MNKNLLEAVKAVCLSAQGVGSNRNYKVGAILFKKGKIYAAKANSYKTHPYILRYSVYPYLHAESACILNQGVDHCEGLSILVARYRNFSNGNRSMVPTMAKPCSCCSSFIRDVGIHNIYYTNWKGTVEHEHL